MSSIQSESSELSGPRPAFSTARSLTSSSCSTDYDTDSTLENIPQIPTDSEHSKGRCRLFQLPRISSPSPMKRYIWPKSNMPDWLRKCDVLDRAEKIRRMKIAAKYSGNPEVKERLELYLTPVPRPTRRDIPRFRDFRRDHKVNPRKGKLSQEERGGGDCDTMYRFNPFRELEDNHAIKSAGRRRRRGNFVMRQKLIAKWQVTDMCPVEDEATWVQEATRNELLRTTMVEETTDSESSNYADENNNENSLKRKRTIPTKILDVVKWPFHWHIEAYKVYKANNAAERERKQELAAILSNDLSVLNGSETSSEYSTESASSDEELSSEVSEGKSVPRRLSICERLMCRKRRPTPDNSDLRDSQADEISRQRRWTNFVMRQELCSEWQVTDICPVEDEAAWVQEATKAELLRTASTSSDSSSVYSESSEYDDDENNNEKGLKKKRTIPSQIWSVVKWPFHWHIEAYRVYKANNAAEGERRSPRRSVLRVPNPSETSSEYLSETSSEYSSESASSDEESNSEVSEEKSVIRRLMCRKRNHTPEKSLDQKIDSEVDEVSSDSEYKPNPNKSTNAPNNQVSEADHFNQNAPFKSKLNFWKGRSWNRKRWPIVQS